VGSGNWAFLALVHTSTSRVAAEIPQSSALGPVSHASTSERLPPSASLAGEARGPTWGQRRSLLFGDVIGLFLLGIDFGYGCLGRWTLDYDAVRVWRHSLACPDLAIVSR
jgi:hypothetical protein